MPRIVPQAGLFAVLAEGGSGGNFRYAGSSQSLPRCAPNCLSA
jgi:hypothetical protein